MSKETMVTFTIVYDPDMTYHVFKERNKLMSTCWFRFIANIMGVPNAINRGWLPLYHSIFEGVSIENKLIFNPETYLIQCVLHSNQKYLMKVTYVTDWITLYQITWSFMKWKFQHDSFIWSKSYFYICKYHSHTLFIIYEYLPIVVSSWRV